MRKLKTDKQSLEKQSDAYAEGVALGLQALAKGRGIPFVDGEKPPPPKLKSNRLILKYAKKVLALQKRLGIDSLVSMRPMKMIQFVKEFRLWYSSLKIDSATTKAIKDYLSLLFHYEHFRDGRRFKVQGKKIAVEPCEWCLLDYLKTLNVEWCSYCNDGHVYGRNQAGRNPAIRSPFDHYFPRKDFPMLGLTLANLVPVCNDCNSLRKGEKCFDTDIYAYPYRDDFHNRCVIKVDLMAKGIDLFLHKGQSGDISIDLKERTSAIACKKTKRFLCDMKIDRLYNDNLQDKALQYIRNIETFPKSYRRFLKKLLPGMTNEQMIKDYFGVSLNPDNINREQHGKMAIDIVHDLAHRRWWGDLKD